jgi:acyl carrier protein
MAETSTLQDEVMNLGNSPGEIRSAVREIVAAALSRSVEEVALDAGLDDDLDVDSLAWIDIGIALEQRFDVDTSELLDPIESGVDTVGDLARFVAARMTNGPGSGRMP